MTNTDAERVSDIVPVAWITLEALADILSGHPAVAGAVGEFRADGHHEGFTVPLYTADIIEAQSKALAAARVVKPLEWREYPTVRHDYGKGVIEANSVVGTYEIDDCAEEMLRLQFLNRWYCRKLSMSYGTLDETKAAAQADYERRILSALTPTPENPNG